MDKAGPWPSPSSNRTCGFPASGFPADSRPEALTKDEEYLRLPLGLQGQFPSQGGPCHRQTRIKLARRFFRNKMFQSARLPSHENASTARPLRSTGITPLPRYYGPLRLPTQPPGGYVFPTRDEATAPAAPDLPGSSTDLSACAVPNHPGEPDGLMARCTPTGGGLRPFWKVGRLA